jgi:hypothetical protein
LVILTHRTHLDTQLYEALQFNCEPYPPFPRTPGDLHRIARFRMNGSQTRVLGASLHHNSCVFLRIGNTGVLT